MDFRLSKSISAPAFVLCTALALFLLIVAFVDTKHSDLSKQHIAFYSISTNDVCSDVADVVFHTNLLNKNKLLDNFTDRFLSFNYGGIFTKVFRKIESLYSATDVLIKNKKVQNFRVAYVQLLSNTKKHDETPLFGITPLHTMFKLEKDCGNLPKPTAEIQSYSCKGEWQSAQIIIVPFADTLQQIEVSIANLPFSATHIQCFWGDYAFCNNSFYPTDKTGWIVDPLIPMDCDTSAKNVKFTCSIVPATIPQGETRSVWLSYFVPEWVAAGNYSISVAVTAKTNMVKQSQLSTIKLSVFDYMLPKTMHLKTAFSFDERNVVNYYHVSEISAQLHKEYYDFLLSYHLNPMALYNSVDNTFPPIDDWQYCIDRGANYFNIGYINYIPSDSLRKINCLVKTLQDKVQAIRQKKLLSYAYIYGFDELPKGHYYQLEMMYNHIHKVTKDIPFACSVQPVKSLSGMVAIWVPNIDSYNETMKPFNKHEKLWEYVCNVYKKNYPNFFIEYPAIDTRIIFWHCSKNNFDGFLYYSMLNWDYNNYSSNFTAEDTPYLDELKKGKRWPDIPWVGHTYRGNVGQRFYNGDGQLIYPGRNMKLYPSVRLLAIRDGIQDYECFYQLKLRQATFEKLGKLDKVAVIESYLAKAYDWMSFDKEDKKDPETLLLLMKEARTLLETFKE